MRNRPWPTMGAAVLLGAAVLASCADYERFPLDLGEAEHGWMVKVEPDEGFSVNLFANPLHPTVEWQLATHDPAIARLVASQHVTVEDVGEGPSPEESVDPVLSVPRTEFTFEGGSLGESPLRFELVVDGVTKNVCEYSLAVVDDACEGDLGIAANRCGVDRDLYTAEGMILPDHGSLFEVEPGGTFRVDLFANALYPDAPWRVAELDPAVATLRSATTAPVRDPGDWDISDPEKPWTFLPQWQLSFEAVAVGSSPLVLEMVADGERIDVFEITVSVDGGACAIDEVEEECE